MIETLLQPLVSEKFAADARYREGHLRVINAMPRRRVLGLHSPEIKRAARELYDRGDSAALIARFANEPTENLVYEEFLVWGFLINMQKCTLGERFDMLAHFVPTMDNWAVCDSWCAHAKWIAKADKNAVWEFLQPYFRSEREFEVRFALIVSMCYFLNDEWLDRIFGQVDALDFDRIKSEYRSAKVKPKTAQEGTVQGAEPYYVRMGVAWLLATTLAKFPDRTRRFVKASTLPADVVKLYVRKARESFRTRTTDAL